MPLKEQLILWGHISWVGSEVDGLKFKIKLLGELCNSRALVARFILFAASGVHLSSLARARFTPETHFALPVPDKIQKLIKTGLSRTISQKLYEKLRKRLNICRRLVCNNCCVMAAIYEKRSQACFMDFRRQCNLINRRRNKEEESLPTTQRSKPPSITASAWEREKIKRLEAMDGKFNHQENWCWNARRVLSRLCCLPFCDASANEMIISWWIVYFKSYSLCSTWNRNFAPTSTLAHVNCVSINAAKRSKLIHL